MTMTTKMERIEALKAMDTLCKMFNNEEGWNIWVTVGVPDCPDEDDYEYIASDDRMFEDIKVLFYTLYREYGRDLWI